MFPDPLTYLLLAVLGGLVAVDGTGCGQFMVSRPFVAATIGGLVMGEPAAGAAIGLVLEAFHLTVLPVGAASYPDGGAPAVAAGAVFATSAGGVVAVLTSTAFFLAWSRVAGESVRLMRRTNAPLPIAAAIPPERLQRRHLRAIGTDFGRGVLLVVAGIAVLSLMLSMARASWGVGERVPQLVADAAVAGLLASGVRLLGGRPAAFAMGAVGALLLLLVV
jgi:mannose/fructose/N-acetylgalactosamine-specific phosphotransferase system component IIC